MANILFSICGQGLGHVTRTLPLIRYYSREDNNIYIASEPNVISFLKSEFPDHQVMSLIEKQSSYPLFERGANKFIYTVNMTLDGLRMPFIVSRENKSINELIERYRIDFAISDGVYGAYSEKVPSFLLTHQLDFIFEGVSRIFGITSRRYNRKIFNKFTKVFVFDYQGEQRIAGELSSNRFKGHNIEYVGILSQYSKLNIEEDVDYLVVISGYLQEHKEEFYQRVMDVLKKRQGKKIFIMGDYINDYHQKLPGDIEIFSSLKGMDKNILYNRAKVIVSRTGYSTLMDLIELGKKSILIPTPNQSEQVYLANYHQHKGYFNIIRHQRDITDDRFNAFQNRDCLIQKINLPKTNQTVDEITSIIRKSLRKH